MDMFQSSLMTLGGTAFWRAVLLIYCIEMEVRWCGPIRAQGRKYEEEKKADAKTAAVPACSEDPPTTEGVTAIPEVDYVRFL